jgi:magnesium-transporting ATPase (P-type)
MAASAYLHELLKCVAQVAGMPHFPKWNCILCLCCTAGTKRSIGNRTEIALLELGVLLGGQPRALRKHQHQLAQVSFSSERKRMTTACLPPGTR